MPEMTMSASQQQRQTQQFSQWQQHSLRILTMPVSELRAYVHSELESNPALEPDEGFYSVPASGSAPEPYESHRNWQADRTLQEELLFQLMDGIVRVPVGFGEYLIACLDGNGYLRMSSAELATVTGFTEQAVEDAVKELQKLEPTGVFARNLGECLLIQLKKLQRQDPIAEQICQGYLEQIAQGRLLQVAKELGCSLGEVRDSLACIRTLNPKPGSGFSGSKTHFILPDLQVSPTEAGELEVTLLTGVSVHINPYYLERLPLVDELTHKYLKGEIDRGGQLIQCIEQRRRTLLTVARAAVDCQRAFFLDGAPLVPLTMAELASLLCVHESTVSRAVSGKYFSSNRGTQPLSRLFCANLSGGGSPERAKLRMAQLIEAEDPAAPLSDEKLTALLAKEGLTLSRRTVAKYRDELGILSSQARRYTKQE